MKYSQKLDNLKEGLVGDYASYPAFKKIFNIRDLSFYQFGILKTAILDLIKKKYKDGKLVFK